MANQFVNGRGNRSNDVSGALEKLKLGRFYPVAGSIRTLIDAETVCKNNVLEATGLSNVIILHFVVNRCSSRGWMRLAFGRLAASKTILPQTASAMRVNSAL